MPKKFLNGLLADPQHWRKSAVEMRSLAEAASDENKATLLTIATEYETLAQRAETRLADEPPKTSG